MKRVVQGIVIESKGNLALVKPTTEFRCSCSCHDDEFGVELVEARNPVNAAIGDQVAFEVSEDGMVMAAFVLFFLPMMLTLIGAAVGYKLSELINIHSTVATMLGAGLFFLLSILIMKLHDKSVSTNTKLMPVITGIISESLDCCRC